MKTAVAEGGPMYCLMSALSTKATSILSVMLEVVKITTLECLQVEGGPVTPGLCLDHAPATRGVRRDALEGTGRHRSAGCTPCPDTGTQPPWPRAPGSWPRAARHCRASAPLVPRPSRKRSQTPTEGPLDTFTCGEALISALSLMAPSPEPQHPQPHDCWSHSYHHPDTLWS